MEKKEVMVMNLKPGVAETEGARRATGVSATAALHGSGTQSVVPSPEVPEKARRRHYTAAYKHRILKEAADCKKQGQVGALLRRETFDSINYFDLEDPSSLARLTEPMTALQNLKGIVVIDEIQRRPELFPILRVLSDRHPLPARFLILGSASPGLLRQSSESLAGRQETIAIGGFSLDDVGIKRHDQHWLRGGLPLSFLAKDETDSLAWRKSFIQTFLERDVPQFGIAVPGPTLLRFWSMLAHYSGQIWNAAEPARSLGISEPSVRRYLDILEGLFIVRQLKPWHENLKKRQVKSPKIYFRDSGLLHQMLGIRTMTDLLLHPKCGASWEGCIVEEVLATIETDEVFFWATHAGAELDLLLLKGNQRIGVEIKRSDAPALTPSMRAAMNDLGLHKLFVIYPGTKRYALGYNIEVLPVDDLPTVGN